VDTKEVTVVDGVIASEIVAEPESIRASLALIDAAASIASELQRAHVRRVFLIGNGTSYHSCLAAATLYRHRASPRDPSVVAITAGEFAHYCPEMESGEALVGISASGEFRDVLSAFQAVRGRVPTIGIIQVPDSSLSRLADHLLVAGGGPSSVPVMSRTFASTLTAAYLLVAQLLGSERASDVTASLARAAEDAEVSISQAAFHLPELAEHLGQIDHFFVVGAGGAYPAALEAALKLKEMALVHAEGVETWEMETGPATLVGPHTAVIALEPEGIGLGSTQDMVRHCAAWGAPIVEVAATPVLPQTDTLPLPKGAEEDFASLVAVPPIALLAFEIARRRGLNPDQPEWRARYEIQGLNHLMGDAASPVTSEAGPTRI
jgi:glucosamine--fructose-6-phosphate aminotransferase (isomerizing)